MRVKTYAAVGILSLILSGCAAGTDDTDSPGPTATATEYVTVSPTTDTDTEQSVSSPEASPSETSVSVAENTPSDGPDDEDSGENGKVLEVGDAGRSLVLADFMLPDDGWQQNRYSIASKKDIKGIGTEISSCGDYSPEILELRLANNFEKLEFSVGQDNLSEMTDQKLVVRVMGNNKELEIYRVPFNKYQTFNVDVSDVNAFSIETFLDEEVESCGGSVGAVFYDLNLQ